MRAKETIMDISLENRPETGDRTGHAPGPLTPQPRQARPRRYVLLTLAACLLAIASGGAGAALALHFDGHTKVTASAPPASQVTGGAASGNLAKVAEAVLPSIVTITVATSSQVGEGSGVIIRSDGMILTNNHVIEAAVNGAGTVKVTFGNGSSADATIVGQDRSADLAVIHAAGVTGLKPAVFGSVSALHVGDTVLAIGSRLGLVGSVTSGIVSALHRTITLPGQESAPYDGLPGQSAPAGGVVSDMIQTDTAINPGNSGGALVNDVGQVVGITTAIASTGGGYIGQQSGSIGVGFAIPADAASRVAVQLMGG
jgi:putative serine protease PepD